MTDSMEKIKYCLAGTNPSQKVNEKTAAVMKEDGIDLTDMNILLLQNVLIPIRTA